MNAEVQQRQGSLWRTVKAVLWSFLGVRKDSEFQADIGRLSPYHIIAVGVIACILLVLSLVAVVKWVVL